MFRKLPLISKLYLSAALLAVASSPGAAAQERLVVTGPDEGFPPVVNLVVRGADGADTIVSALVYQKSFTGGVRVAVGDVNGDGVPEVITAPGPGMGSQVRVFDLESIRRMRGPWGSLMAYRDGFQGGVYVAAGDVNGDGRADIITGPDKGSPPHVKVFDVQTGAVLSSFLAYNSSFTGGVRVAAGDLNGDGRAEIITAAGPGGGPHVKVFDSSGELSSFFAYDPTFTGGVFVATGDVNGDGYADLITGAGGGPGGGPHVKAFDAHNSLNLLFSFFAFDPTFTGGVRVAAGDVNGDRVDEIIVAAGPGGGPHVKVFDLTNQNVLHDFFAYDPKFTGGVFVAGFSAKPAR